MRILLAEDDRVFRVLLHKVLVKWGYEPDVVGDGEQAWRALTAKGGPRLAILDWMMPHADGLEVCRRVRTANLPHYVYMVLLTGKTETSDLVEGLEAGADDYLLKPVNLHQLKLRLRAATRVLEAEERHRMIAEIASDGIVTMNGENIIGFANSAAGSIFGYRANELTGRTFSELAPGFESLLVRASSETATANGSTAGVRSWAPIELVGRHATGRDLSLEVSFAESMNSVRQRVVTAMIRDVTERRDRDLQRAHTQKLESIGQLAAGVAHEINTPVQYIGDNLRFIEGSLQGLQRLLEVHQTAMRDCQTTARCSTRASEIESIASAIDLDYLMAETPSAIAQAREGVTRVAEIVRALKEFSHPGVETSPVALNHLIETTALISRTRWKYVANLKTDFDADLPDVNCMAGEMGQVILNLLVNGADAIADAIKGKPGEKGALSIRTRHDGAFAEIRVSDTGTGIPPEVRSKIFDPFFTTKAVGSGTGQGLSIAYAIVTKKHRGTISFETEMGIGTTFVVRLPIAGPRA
jgi:two-component system, NtrC family, sensor kinase